MFQGYVGKFMEIQVDCEFTWRMGSQDGRITSFYKPWNGNLEGVPQLYLWDENEPWFLPSLKVT